MQKCQVLHSGITSTLFIDDPSDYVQQCAARGVFYEIEQLEFHNSLIPNGSIVADIGANVGNHTLYYITHCRVNTVYSFEPSKRATDLLKATVSHSPRGGKANLENLGIAVSDHDGVAHVGPAPRSNLGATRVRELADFHGVPDEGQGIVRCSTLDSLFSGPRLDFIKIDVEGHEIKVITGALKTIARHRPTLAVEVNKVNEEQFWRMMDSLHYICIRAFFDYVDVKNYVMIPRSVPGGRELHG